MATREGASSWQSRDETLSPICGVRIAVPVCARRISQTHCGIRRARDVKSPLALPDVREPVLARLRSIAGSREALLFALSLCMQKMNDRRRPRDPDWFSTSESSCL
jgi:hypothetical protein